MRSGFGAKGRSKGILLWFPILAELIKLAPFVPPVDSNGPLFGGAPA